MSDLKSLECLTCLSTVEDGTRISKSMMEFLRDELHFKDGLEGKYWKFVCRNCYRTLIEIRRFFSQLRDVEQYYQQHRCKLSPVEAADEIDLVDEVVQFEEVAQMEEVVEVENTEGIEEDIDVGDLGDTFIVDMGTVNENEEMKDPILTVPEPVLNIDYHVVESSEPPPILPKLVEKPKVTKDSGSNRSRPAQKAKPTEVIKPKEKRFVCLFCSKLFSSITDLRSHESLHTNPSQPDIIPIFRGVRMGKRRNCPKCGDQFDILRDYNIHLKNHELDKIKPFRCFKCPRRFTTKEEFDDHQLSHESAQVHVCQCDLCGKKYFNQTTLEAHKRIAHKIYIASFATKS